MAAEGANQMWQTAAPNQDAGSICKAPFPPFGDDAVGDLPAAEHTGGALQGFVGRQVHIH